ncbi:MAG: hypothetical protein HY514_01435 [Candidatus Aenigmarchaeota archaeon]|nr:hypothetical protein [Candidatus Aenigmarchaeota archaeon]
MNYERTVQEWVEEKRREGLPEETAYSAVMWDIRKLETTAKGMARKSRPIDKKMLQELKKYVETYGFQEDGTWYFRASWMTTETREALAAAGYIEKIGSVKDLQKLGVSHSHGFKTSSNLFYRVNRETI